MDKKSIFDLLLKKVNPEKQDAFKEELKACASKEDRANVMKKYGVEFTEDEKKYLETLKDSSLSNEELDQVAGGCSFCTCNCYNN